MVHFRNFSCNGIYLLKTYLLKYHITLVTIVIFSYLNVFELQNTKKNIQESTTLRSDI